MSKVLIVEDSRTISGLIQKFLLRNSYEVTDCVAFAEKAIESIPEKFPDLVLMDINLSGEMDGIRAASIIRNNWDIPVLFLTSEYSEDIMRRAARARPYGYLRKPFEEYHLIAQMDLALRLKKIEVKTLKQRKRAVNRLRQSEEKFRKLSEDMPSMICTFTSDSTLTYVNKAYADFFNSTPEALLGARWLDFVPETEREAARKNFQQLSVEHPFNSYEHRVTNESGDLKWMAWTDRALFDDQGHLNYYLAIGLDITKQKQTTLSLAENERALSQVLKALKVGMMVLDRDSGVITRANAEALACCPNQKIIGAAIDDVMSALFPDQNVSFASIVQKMPYFNEERSLKTIRGTKIPVLCSAFSSGLNSEKTIILTFHDISEHKELEMQLTHAQKMKAVGSLAAGIAHEINTPAQYVGDNIRFLKDAFHDLLNLVDKCRARYDEQSTFFSKHEFEQMLEQADYSFLQSEVPSSIDQSLQGIDHISNIVRAMKRFSHPGERNDMTSIDLKDAIENTLAISRNEWKYVAETKITCQSASPIVHGYPNDLNQVFLNLIVNAAYSIKKKVGSTGKKGLIHIHVSISEGHARIDFTDTGTGIPHEIQDRIFEQFFTTKPVGMGTGQGLALAYSIVVDKHQGKISFQSTPQKGTTFTVLLPTNHKEEKGQ
ncbi:PAS domain S-box protein [Desulfonatronovibrio magnus]|uniref:PAS domain S-box protein n=1 Tax=Desulfonatronovibrio magnus TaxID=698827 RepID=UPI0006980554|nr:PAS domain S-box protein [Desulfonatronovibrio magnus]RQD66631.1 MAG: PAS domain S-box protein [Desulfonatronovibrio sp. MSAO_Bac4]